MTVGVDDEAAHAVQEDGQDGSPSTMETELLDGYLELCRRVPPPHFFWRAPNGEILFCAGMRTRRVPPDPAAWREWCREDLRLDDTIPAVFLASFSPTEAEHHRWRSFSPVLCFQPVAGLLIREGKTLRWGMDENMRAGSEHANGDAGGNAGEQDGAVPNSEIVASATRSTTPECSDENADGEAYRDRVRQVLDLLRERKLGKVVMARECRLRLPRPFDLARILRSMLRQRDSFTLCYSPDGAHYFLSATPERLGRIVDGRFETIALAGTMAHVEQAIPDETLLADAKEIREHEFVVEMLRAGCEEFATDVKVEATRVLALRHIRHILTRVEGRMRAGCGLRHVIAALHPTPAVGGTPRSDAMQVIETIEPFARGMYAGCAGWFLGDGDGDAAVTIRSALVHGDDAILWAGAGIVRDSNADAEERETRAKLRTMRDILDG